MASFSPRNAPGLRRARDEGRLTTCVHVKTESGQYDIGGGQPGPDGTIFRDLFEVSDFTVLVNLTIQTCDLQFFVFPTSLVHQWLVSRFERWLNTPGKNGRPHSPTKKKRYLGYREHAEALLPYQDNWDVLWEESNSSQNLKESDRRFAELEGEMPC